MKRVNNEAKKKRKLPSIPTLRRKAMKLWLDRIREINGGKCAVCDDAHPKLNSHHIENRSHPGLRYDLLNGIALCPRCHAFGRDAAHKTIFFYEWLIANRPAVVEYLRHKRTIEVSHDREALNIIIDELSSPVPKHILYMMNIKTHDSVEEQTQVNTLERRTENVTQDHQ